MKLGYNEHLGAAKFVCYNRYFIIPGIFYGIKHGFGTKKFVHYNREFVITEFDCSSNSNAVSSSIKQWSLVSILDVYFVSLILSSPA